MDSLDIARVVGSADTVSNKIRRMAAGGVPRAEIARLLGKRYQHVRNVLEGDKLRRTPPGVEEEAGPAPFDHGRSGQAARPVGPGVAYFRLILDNDGRLTLPPGLIAAWGLKVGSVLMGHLEGETFEIVTGETSARRARDFVRGVIPAEVSLVDELIADRRREAAREEASG